MSDLIPRKSWTLAFEGHEENVFEIKELTDSEYLSALDISEAFYNEKSTRVETEKAKLDLYEFMVEKVDGYDNPQVVPLKFRLNVALRLLKYLNPDVLEIKK